MFRSKQFAALMLAAALPLALPEIGLAQTSADSGWVWQNPLPDGNHLYATAVLDSNTAVAVGGNGTILRTTDGGARTAK